MDRSGFSLCFIYFYRNLFFLKHSLYFLQRKFYTICININNTDDAEGRGLCLFELDIRSRKPIYEQLMDNIKELIVTGILQPKEKLPSVRALSQQLTVNPNTIQKAYRELEREGYLYSVSRKGYFVAPRDHIEEDKLSELKETFQSLLREAIYLGLTKEQLEKWFDEVKEGGERNDLRQKRDEKF